VAPAQPQRVIN